MRVLHICETAIGGTGAHLQELIPFQVRYYGADNVRLLVPSAHLAHLKGIPHVCLTTFNRPSRLLGLMLLFIETVYAVVRFKPDVIHAHSTFSGFAVRLLNIVLWQKVIYCPHGWAMDMKGSSLRKKVISAVEYALSFFCKKIIAVSENERKRGIEIGIAPEKIVTIYNGIAPLPDNLAPAKWDSAKLKVLFVGRLDAQKGIDVLLHANQGLEAIIDVRIIGDSVAGDSSIDFSTHFNVTPLGWQTREAIAAQMAACDVVVMPSRWEGLPIVALEAMRLAKPIIAASVGGIPEAVIDGETGLLFTAEDSGKLKELLGKTKADELKRMGPAGYARFLMHFSADKMAASMQAVYQAVATAKV